MKFIASLLIGTMLVSAPQLSHAEEITTSVTLRVEDYLNQIRERSPGFQSTRSGAHASQLKSREGSLLFVPTLSLNASFTDDKRVTANPTFQGDRTLTTSSGISINELTPWGMTLKLGYAVNAIRTSNASLLPVPSYVVAEPRFDLTQNIFGGGFGAASRATVDQIEANQLAASFTEDFKAKQILAAAELAYWRLAFARRIVFIQRAVLERATSLFEWSSRRARLNLSDRSDVLQARAAMQLRKLELKNAEDEIRLAGQAFNTQRFQTGSDVTETLETLDGNLLASLSVPNRGPAGMEIPREDVLAAQQLERAAAAGSVIGREKNRPSLDLFFSYGGNGLNADTPTALNQSWDFTHPYISAGIKFTSSLAFGTYGSVQEGYELSRIAASQALQKTVFDSDQEWKDLNQSFQESKDRLVLAIELRQLQKEKLDYERDRLKRGRSTTYQVLLFEQDYSQAELSLIRASSDVLRFYTQLKTFGAPTT